MKLNCFYEYKFRLDKNLEKPDTGVNYGEKWRLVIEWACNRCIIGSVLVWLPTLLERGDNWFSQEEPHIEVDIQYQLFWDGNISKTLKNRFIKISHWFILLFQAMISSPDIHYCVIHIHSRVSHFSPNFTKLAGQKICGYLWYFHGKSKFSEFSHAI